ncbi:GbsR/MarR family transcriptional regulator [Alkalihalobacillus sp. MEB130]|uniref:GbsR/MarR family transcriptional regulator n=1 Tax=Alkalihalobacillus sp. MEB130 TaxID=2976704 RepID=UPI0028DFCEFB|nr:GbsR/MarR family transcriptional regulator [Alkalihalobacillus sp. MEB130]MDT8861929.1 GbsR/MarR family transcriptional regulator [Alkalihalobacillus sp. MEB130]
MGEKEQLERARARFIDSMAQNMNLYGITPSVGRLYGLLYFSETPMTLDCMKDELGMSKTSMSTSVRQLQELKMVEKVWKKGVRKDLYQSIDDWYETFSDLFSVKWRMGVSLNISSLRKSLDEINELIEDQTTSEELKAEARIDKEKLEHALEYYHWINRLIDSIETKEIFKFIPKGKDKE